MAGVIALSDAIKDMGALTSLNLASNNLGELVLPDGWSIKDTNMSYQMYVHADGRDQKCHPGKPEGVIALANAIPDMRAISKLIFGGDDSDKLDTIKREYIKHTPAVLEVGMTEADLSNRGLGVGGAIIVSTWISHKDNGALTSLNLSSNKLEAEGGKIVAEAIKVTNNAMAVVLAPFSCPSDHWLNCCCLLLSTG
jgi:hypothetical protein